MSSSAYAENRKTTPRIRTVETTMLLSDAAARLKNGLCKMMTLPMRWSPDITVGSGA